MIRFSLITLSTLLLFATAVSAADRAAKLPPIRAVKNAKPNKGVFAVASRKKPLIIRSEKDAAKHFTKKGLAELKKQVDFGKQIVLVFAWRGSGQDRLAYDVLESFPEQVVFKYKPGRTRDLRPHIYMYVLRSNVKWKIR